MSGQVWDTYIHIYIYMYVCISYLSRHFLLSHVLSQFMHGPWIIRQLLGYWDTTKQTLDLVSPLKKSNLHLVICSDADNTRSLVDCRSTMGCYTMFRGSLVTWRSKKQIIVFKSSIETEFRALSSGSGEMLWIWNILKDLKISYEEPIRVLCDNKSSITLPMTQ